MKLCEQKHTLKNKRNHVNGQNNQSNACSPVVDWSTVNKSKKYHSEHVASSIFNVANFSSINKEKQAHATDSSVPLTNCRQLWIK
jgi:hypothetical protein